MVIFFTCSRHASVNGFTFCDFCGFIGYNQSNQSLLLVIHVHVSENLATNAFNISGTVFYVLSL